MIELDLLGKQAEKYSAEIKEWNIHCVLPEGFILADGKSVSKFKKGYVDHGVDFGDVSTIGFKMGSQSVREEHPEANIIELHPYKTGVTQVVNRS